MMRARDHNIQADPLLANMVLFPPNEKNNLCTKETPEVPCAPNSWVIKVNNIGTYEVKITSGDAERVSINSITVNGVYAFKNVALQANQFDTQRVEVQVADGKIVVAAECDDTDPPDQCRHVWSRMSAVYVK